MASKIIQNIYGFLKLALNNVLPINIVGNNMEDIYNFQKVSDSIATSGQPTKEQFSQIKDSGYQIVVNLALPTSANALPDEKETVENLGMQYVHIPVVWEEPKFEDFTQFYNVMTENEDKNTFVHCAANMRVSAFMYLYNRLHENMSDEEAKKNLYQIWIPNDTWQKFITQVIKRYR